MSSQGGRGSAPRVALHHERTLPPHAPGQDDVTTRLARILGSTTVGTLDDEVATSLREVGSAQATDTAFAVVLDATLQTTGQWHWTREGLTTPSPGTPVWQLVAGAAERLRQGAVVTVADRPARDDALVPSALLVPVTRGRDLVGVTGLEVLVSPRRWTQPDIAVMALLGELLVQAVQRTDERAQLATADARARRIAAHLPDGLVLLEPRGLVTWVSPSLTRTLGRPGDELIGRQGLTLVHPEDQDRVADAIFRELEQGQGVTARVVAGDGWRWAELSWQLTHDDDPAVPDEVVISVRDVHDKHLRTEALAKDSLTDDLTGVLNRLGLEEAVTALAAANADVLVAFVDVDAFKTVNDTVGHDAGDQVLRTVARALQGAIRAADHVARIGGDEFCVVAHCNPRTTGEAEAMSARLLRSVRAAVSAASCGCSVSIGIAGPGPASEVGTLRTAADQAMYRAKRAGGDRCEIEGP